ncbi:hypothetical protein SCNU_04786 [Gordonia neofelifaecis NRRL B-59395]|uniref:TPM domain-containing protein n=1 Tax=Gordonia neofelifaecis NRRL B-59395 TaxID=644548 RepID=F1YGC6_9ACTN|nr:hypothetical protein SCNU_04786 [Gordonia neofelifaecis NRRL B-59395]
MFVLAEPATQPQADVWSNLDMAAIKESLTTTGVWAPADQQAALKELVQQADADGHSLHVVVLDQSYPKFTAYRDIATELQSQVGGTVLVFGPSGSGTASSEFSRVQLEDASSDVTKGSTATQAATQMYHKAVDPNVNWNGVTIGLIVLVVIGAVIARLQMKRKRRAESDQVPAAVGGGSDDGEPDDGAPSS